MSISAEIYNANQNFLWGLCYRMTGNAADADEIVQETFVRAIESPPRNFDEPLRPWLVRVAINLSRDLLRRRKRRTYIGEWLPSPVRTETAEDPPAHEPPAPAEESPAARYEMLESLSLAFLLALEALTPTARAVLLLRDVFDYSTRETADALDITEASVKVTLHRARKAMGEYDKGHAKGNARLSEMTRGALERFLFYLNSRNVAGLEQLLAEDVVSLSDGGGEVYAAINPIYGRRNVIRLVLGLAEKSPPAQRLTFTTLNGSPALLVESDHDLENLARRFTVHCEVDEGGRITRLLTVAAPSKLTAV